MTPLNLLNGQKLIGQDATASLSSITGLVPPAESDPLPTMNSANATIVNLTSAAGGIFVAQNNTLRGFTGGNEGTDIGGTNSRLALFDGTPAKPNAVVIEVFPSAAHSGLAEVVRVFRERHNDAIEAACFGPLRAVSDHDVAAFGPQDLGDSFGNAGRPTVAARVDNLNSWHRNVSSTHPTRQIAAAL